MLHEKTFRPAAEDAGLNPFLVQMANIREHVAWVTTDKQLATARSKAQLAAAVRRVADARVTATANTSRSRRACMIVGGGIAGIHAALTLANAGKEVILVERQPTIGGHMAMFDKTFPTLDCAACILTPKMTAVKDHPNIKLLTYSEVESVSGSVGNYKVQVKRFARYVNESACVGCMECIDACVFRKPKFDNEFDLGLGKRKPIYMPFPQAVPPVPVIDATTCLMLKKRQVQASRAWKPAAIAAPSTSDAAAAHRGVRGGRASSWPPASRVLTPAPCRNSATAAVPTSTRRWRSSVCSTRPVPRKARSCWQDGSTPKRIGIVHCIGSRDHHYHRYCSRVCCMYSLKLAHLAKEKTGRRGVQLLHRHPRARQGIRRVLRARAARGSAISCAARSATCPWQTAKTAAHPR